VVRNRCLFLDRDGVINVKPRPGEYIRSWSHFRLIPGIADWIRIFNTLDFRVIVVTNQRGVARGIMTDGELAELHARMLRELASQGARIDDIFCCTHEEGSCDCRKPRPGMVLQAAAKWNLDLAGSLFIGDSDCDEQTAAACGVKFLRVDNGRITAAVPIAAESPRNAVPCEPTLAAAPCEDRG
jgi:histidinol-phosphate phosphatase family protein